MEAMHETESTCLLEKLELMIEDPYTGIIYIDNKCRVVFINQTLADILGKNKYESVGKPISEIMPRSRLPETIKSGESNLCEVCSIRGRKMVAMRAPIYDQGNIIGAMSKSLFLDMSTAKNMAAYLGSKDTSDSEAHTIKSGYKTKYTLENIVGSSPTISMPKAISRQVANNVSNVLIVGESGTGKELFAQAIHNAGSRSNAPFVRINCACIPDNLLESELFGYEEGAFTGAKKGGKKGKLEMASHGTIFLDEISEMPLVMQSKLLSFLQEREFERVGGSEPITADVRVIAATNINLEEAVLQGKFREDLYFRLNVVTLMLPPLRDRVEDIPLLINHFMDKLSRKLNTPLLEVDSDALHLLKAYHWPGNIRELENILERAINLACMEDELNISAHHFPTLVNQVNADIQDLDPHYNLPLSKAVENLEHQMIMRTLQNSNDNKVLAAKILDIHPSVLYRKIKKYNLG